MWPYEKNFPYHINIDLKADFDRIADEKLKKQGVKGKSKPKAGLDYCRLQQRLVENKPRIVKKAGTFSCPQGYEKALKLIEGFIEQGENIHPFMTRNLKNLRNEDLLLSDWGIYHLHLSDEIDEKKRDGFMKRSDKLLMVRIDEKCVYFITVVSHNEKNLWTLKQYIQIIRDNWPETIEKYRLPEVKAVEHITEDKHTLARKKHALTMTELEDGSCYMLLGGGYASDGSSITAVRMYDTCMKQLHDAEKVLRNNLSKQSKLREWMENEVEISTSAPLDIHLVAIGDKSFLMIEEKSRLWIHMKLENECWKIVASLNFTPKSIWEQ